LRGFCDVNAPCSLEGVVAGLSVEPDVLDGRDGRRLDSVDSDMLKRLSIDKE
jgi:hypothetical protein